jgi:hypothetical protein
MTADDHSRLNEEIRKRLSSVSWDLSVARAVLKKRRRVVLSTAAAGAVFVFLIGVLALLGTSGVLPWGTLSRHGGGASRDAFFIARQVEGTYDAVFTAPSALGTSGASPISSITFDVLDELIDETLESR